MCEQCSPLYSTVLCCTSAALCSERRTVLHERWAVLYKLCTLPYERSAMLRESWTVLYVRCTVLYKRCALLHER